MALIAGVLGQYIYIYIRSIYVFAGVLGQYMCSVSICIYIHTKHRGAGELVAFFYI